MRGTSVGREHFERLYAARPDPWNYQTSGYERAKYDASLAALPCARYTDALDVGCSVGVLTEALARRCDRLLAVDAVEAALDTARQRNAAHPHVSFATMTIPGDWPDGSFDLVVMSEVIDYLGEADLASLVEKLRVSLRPGGDLLLVHWVAKKGAMPRPGEATDILAALAGDMLESLRADRNSDYRLDLFRRR